MKVPFQQTKSPFNCHLSRAVTVVVDSLLSCQCGSTVAPSTISVTVDVNVNRASVVVGVA